MLVASVVSAGRAFWAKVRASPLDCFTIMSGLVHLFTLRWPAIYLIPSQVSMFALFLVRRSTSDVFDITPLGVRKMGIRIIFVATFPGRATGFILVITSHPCLWDVRTLAA